MAKAAIIASKNSLAIHLDDGTSGVLPFTHPKFKDVAALMSKSDLDDADVDLIRSVIDTGAAVRAAVAKVATGALEFTGDAVLFRGKPLNMEACRRIVEIAQNGIPVDRFVKFLDKVLNNPIESARNELWQFMEASGLPINENGNFVAYKIVRDNYMDIFSGTFDNSVGKVCEVKPFEVDPDRNRTCSTGLHVCGKDYLPHYGNIHGDSRIMIVEVDPAHVVAVPVDYKFHKMRTWKYTVIGELTDKSTIGVLETRGVVDTANGLDFEAFENEGWNAVHDLDNDDYNVDADARDSYNDDDDNDEDLDGADRADDDAQATLFVKDDYLEAYYPATVGDIRDGSKLYVYNGATGEYDAVGKV